MDSNLSILNAVKTMINKAISTAPYDVTRKAQVLALNSDNTCSLRMDGINYPNVEIYGKGDIKTGDIVRVKIPMNNTSQMYVTLVGGTTSIPTATTSVYGITKLSTAVNSTSDALAATPSAVKTAYDLANTANTTANTANTKANAAYSLAENSGMTDAEIANLRFRLGLGTSQGTISSGGSFPTTGLGLGDYVTADSTAPFTIDTIYFSTEGEQAYYTGTEWVHG